MIRVGLRSKNIYFFSKCLIYCIVQYYQIYLMRSHNQLSRVQDFIQKMAQQAQQVIHRSNAKTISSNASLSLQSSKANHRPNQIIKIPLRAYRRIERQKSNNSKIFDKAQRLIAVSFATDKMFDLNNFQTRLKNCQRYDKLNKSQEQVKSKNKRMGQIKKQGQLASSLQNLQNNYKRIIIRQLKSQRLFRQSSSQNRHHQTFLSSLKMEETKQINTISHYKSVTKSGFSNRMYKVNPQNCLILKKGVEKSESIHQINKNMVKHIKRLSNDYSLKPQPWGSDYRDFQEINQQM